MGDTGDDVLKVDWGDGVSALDRVMRTIVMAADGAIQRLVEQGYDRDRDGITLVHDPVDIFPTWIRCCGRRVYEISMEVQNRGLAPVVCIRGRWLKLGWWTRLWMRRPKPRAGTP